MSRSTALRAAPARIRCAIYTRKSSEEGLEQGFNSLHAQREACEAYVLSQAGEGWGALQTAYDDGGFSGGSLDRPGVQQLLADVDAGRIDVVVVYKVDRLTRSLADFAKMVERFDARGVSFVSVTQAFNTTTSMGRLTLNVLLSFAQFEREVTGERIRDKIAASKAKGMWMGGNLPLGYDADGRKLKVNEAEAGLVRHIFRRHLDLGSVHALRDELEAEGVVSKRQVAASGRERGGVPFGRGALFHLLSNRVYLGQITHKDQAFPGLHAAIIDQQLFDDVQLRLAQNAGAERRARAGLKPNPPTAPLTGLVFDDQGHPMAPVGARKRGGKTYRYYVSTAVLLGRKPEAGSLARFPAPALEELVRDRVQRLAGDGPAAGGNIEKVRKIEVGRRRVVVHLEPDVALEEDLELLERRLPEGDVLEEDTRGLVLTAPVGLKKRGGAHMVVGPRGQPAIDRPQVDPVLLKALAKAEAWKAQLLAGEVATVQELAGRERMTATYAARLVRLAFLSPDLKRSILDGRTSSRMLLEHLVKQDLPLLWDQQGTLVGPL